MMWCMWCCWIQRPCQNWTMLSDILKHDIPTILWHMTMLFRHLEKYVNFIGMVLMQPRYMLILDTFIWIIWSIFSSYVLPIASGLLLVMWSISRGYPLPTECDGMFSEVVWCALGSSSCGIVRWRTGRMLLGWGTVWGCNCSYGEAKYWEKAKTWIFSP